MIVITTFQHICRNNPRPAVRTGYTLDKLESTLTLANPTGVTAKVNLRFFPEDAESFDAQASVPPYARETIFFGEFPALAGRRFAIEADFAVDSNK